MTQAAQASSWSRRFVYTGAIFLVAWQVIVVAGASRQAAVTVGLLGFVFHTIFGKGYALIPTYFDRELATTRFMPLHLGLTALGVMFLAVHAERGVQTVGQFGAGMWMAGITLFVGTIAWTIRTNPTGAETGTSEANSDRQPIDRIANLFMPIALGYLVAGSYELLAVHSGFPAILHGYPPQATHLLAAGTGALLVFAIGFRLLPRFLVARSPRPLVWLVLPTGALAPVFLAAGLPAGRVFQIGAVLQAIAIAGFALAFWILFVRSDRRRIGFYGVLSSTFFGLAGVAFGLVFAVDHISVSLIDAHLRLNLLGFLGLAIIGVSYQFYPPAIGTWPGIGDRLAGTVIALFTVGLLLEVVGLTFAIDSVTAGGLVLAVIAATVHCYILTGLFVSQ